MKPRHAILGVALLALPIAAGGDRVETSSPQPALSQGMVITIDSSGKLTQGAQATDLRAVLGEAVSTSTEGLVEEKSPVPGGGVMVDLQGRFQNAMVMEVDANGNVSAPCVSGAPGEVK